MQYKCEAMGRQCLVEVEVRGDRINVMIYTDDQQRTILDSHPIHLDTGGASFDIQEMSERAARTAIAHFEGLGKLGSHPKSFSGTLIPVA